MARPNTYRDNYDGRGKYARENEAMLDRECLRIHEWQTDPALRKPAVVPLLPVAAVLLVAVVMAISVYFLAFGLK